MARAPRICSIHGCPDQATRLNRCPRHAAQLDKHQRRTTPTKIHGSRDRRRRAHTVRTWRNEHGDWCPGYKRAPHPAIDLTAEHTHPIAEGGDPAGTLSVLCRSCNSRHGAETLNRLLQQ